MKPAKTDRVLGITVLADFILSEGVEPIIANLRRVGATAVACNPTVTAACDEGTGTFQPPADAGSSPRLFDRPLFGKRALWVNGAPSYVPNPKYYADSAYPPRKVKPLTEEHGGVIERFIEAAQQAGLRVYFQLGAVQPSGLRDEDRPRQPDGSVAAIRMADTGCLASPAIRSYNRAYVADLLAKYSTIAGFRIDWPEYPCYTMGEVLHDFNPQVADWARSHGFDYHGVQSGMKRLYDRLHGGVTPRAVNATESLGIDQALATVGGESPDLIDEWLNIKAALSADIVADWKAILADLGRSDLELTAHAFMWPYSRITGLDFAQVAKHCDCISAKFYTMHWPLMVKFWSDWLADRNPQLNRSHLVRRIARWMELGSTIEIEERLNQYRYPEPHEAHPIPVTVQQQKLRQVREQLGDRATAFVPLVHGYGTPDDFEARFEVIAAAGVDGIWINRYGYLSDEKLDAIARVWND